MATPAQVKRNNKYANKSQFEKGNIHLNLGENNHLDPKDFDMEIFILMHLTIQFEHYF